MTEPDLRRCLRVLAMTNEERCEFALSPSEERDWFLKSIDDLAPTLHELGWVRRADFDHRPGAIVVTTGQGDVRMLELTDLGRAQLSAAVLS